MQREYGRYLKISLNQRNVRCERTLSGRLARCPIPRPRSRSTLCSRSSGFWNARSPLRSRWPSFLPAPLRFPLWSRSAHKLYRIMLSMLIPYYAIQTTGQILAWSQSVFDWTADITGTGRSECTVEIKWSEFFKLNIKIRHLVLHPSSSLLIVMV